MQPDIQPGAPGTPGTPTEGPGGAQPKGVSISSISIRSFLSSFIILAALMVLAYVLTFLLPAGVFARTETNGQVFVVPGTYAPAEGGLPFWKWLLSPVLVLGAEGGGMMAAIIVFLFIVAGTFMGLEKAGLLQYMLEKLAARFAARRRMLLFLMPLLFMAMGAFIGSFEEVIPMAPLAISLSLAMGWDVLLGLGMSVLAVGFGFATGVLNPFTVGVAQSLADLPMFSGVWMRLLSFVVVYALLMLFLSAHANRLEKAPGWAARQSAAATGFAFTKQMDKALAWFVGILLAGIALILVCSLVGSLSGLVLPITALMFFAAGLVCVPLAGKGFKNWGRWFLQGMLGLAPAAVLLLMASSVRYTLAEANVIDTLLNMAVGFIEGKPQGVTILLVYLVVLLLNSVIPSGSAKAFLLIPLITPVVDMAGISRQLSILAFAYGDGFSNMFYPTNPALLICLSIAGIGYGKWFRFTWKLQLATLAATAGLLLFGLAVGYA